MLLSIEVDKLVEKGAVERVAPLPLHQPAYYSTLFLVPKSDCTVRPVFNLRQLNSYLVVPHFKMEGLNVARLTLRRGDWLFKVDIKDAFFHVPVHPGLRDWLRFKWQGCHYHFSALPFGLSASPRAFTKVLREALRMARERGLRLVQYADDILGMATSRVAAGKDVAWLMAHLRRLGFLINMGSSVVEPTQRLIFLGFVVDTVKFSFFLPKDKRKALQKCLRGLLRKKSVTMRSFASLVGKLLATGRAVAPATLLCGPLVDYQGTLLAAGVKWDDPIRLPTAIRKEMEQWLSFLLIWNGSAILPAACAPEVIITSDASGSGWGATLAAHKACGFWTRQQGFWHINRQELMAVLLALKAFRPMVTGKYVLIRTDSMVALAYVNKMAGRKTQLRELAKTLWEWTQEAGVRLVAEHIPGVDNVEADRLSRRSDSSDWRLHPEVYELIDELWGPHDVDLFATPLNAQLPTFFTWCHQPGSAGVDAFRQDWMVFQCPYANPPFAMIPRVLHYLRARKVTITMVAPYWPQQHWWPDLLELLVEPPLLLPQRDDLFLPGSKANSSSVGPPAWRTLVVCLSGAPSSIRAFRKRFLQQSWTALRRRRPMLISQLGWTSSGGLKISPQRPPGRCSWQITWPIDGRRV